jgi:pimeloyl-ACP methyl ester carboxylesterase
VRDELLDVHGCDNANRIGDILFIHGLNGNAHDYWCYGGKSENFWPAWVGEDLPDVGVWSLGYENAAFKSSWHSILSWFPRVCRSGYWGFAMPMSDRVKTVMLHLETRGLGKRPLVFVTHSMGGLLVKQLLRTAYEKSAKEPWKDIVKNTRGVCFIATPHIGSDLANLANWASYFGVLLKINVSAEELKPHAAQLRELNEFYREFVSGPNVNVKTLTFIEKKPVAGNTMVVAEGDADPGVAQAALYPLSEDHISICKPRSNAEPIHIKLIDFITRDCFQLAAPRLLRSTPTRGLSSPIQPTSEFSSAPESRLRVIRRHPRIITVVAMVLLVVLGISFYFVYSRAFNYDDKSNFSSFSYLEALAFRDEAVARHELASAQKRVLEKRVDWYGFHVEPTVNGCIIQPREQDPADGRERAFVGYRNPRENLSFRKGERVRVIGRVSRFDTDEIDIAGATITPDVKK